MAVPYLECGGDGCQKVMFYRLGAWSDADWNAWVQERKENSIIFGSGEEKAVQKILTPFHLHW